MSRRESFALVVPQDKEFRSNVRKKINPATNFDEEYCDYCSSRQYTECKPGCNARKIREKDARRPETTEALTVSLARSEPGSIDEREIRSAIAARLLSELNRKGAQALCKTLTVIVRAAYSARENEEKTHREQTKRIMREMGED